MFQTVLYAIGRGLRTAGLAILHLLWEVIVEIARGLARGASDSLRRVMPWVMGIAALWMLMVVSPQLFQQVALLGVMVFGFRIMLKSFTAPAPKKKKGR
ncbi:MAG: hypothetical protein AAB780_01530 [Patescibacteria group bacterium]